MDQWFGLVLFGAFLAVSTAGAVLGQRRLTRWAAREREARERRLANLGFDPVEDLESSHRG